MNPSYAVAVLAAAVYGTADFLGGYAARRVPVVVVTFAASAVGLVLLVAASPFLRGTPVPADYGWGVLAGVCGGAGVALLYRALAIGPVSVAAPVISLTALSMPVAVGIALGERPSALALAGMALAVCAIPLLSSHDETVSDSGPSWRSRVIPVAVASGVLVGGFLVTIGRISSDAGLPPLLVARTTTMVLFGIALLWRRVSPWPAGAARPTFLSGILDAFANVAYYLAVRHGNLAIVGTIVSLAPAATVVLARLVLRERWNRRQRAGLVCAAAAIVCVSLG